MTTEQTPTSKPRGFAAMTPEARKALASQGGKAAHQQGRAHEFTSASARIAGAKGGRVAQRNRLAAKQASEP